MSRGDIDQPSYQGGSRRISVELNLPLGVMRGLDPRIHLLLKKMDCRVKPGNDDQEYPL
jgi:hypothetical protein